MRIITSKKQTRFFSILTSLLMIFTLIIPGLAGANSIGENSISARESNVSVESKLSEKVLNAYEEEEKVTFLIKLVEKADTKAARLQAESKAEQENLSSFQATLTKRSAVLSELKATALETQQDVLAYLEQEAELGNVDDIHPYFIVNGIAVTATKEVAEKVAAFSEVEKVLPNETRTLIESEQKRGKNKHLQSNDMEWNVERIGAPLVWNMGVDGTGTVVANLDSGVDWEHPALQEKYRGLNSETGEVDHQYSWYDASNHEGVPYDDNGHGTHTMGTMVGSEEDGSNQVGVAPGAKWIGVKVFNSFGETSDAILLDGAEWILAPGGRVDMTPDAVNNSWSSGPGMDEWYRDVVRAWRDMDIFPEFAAGNVNMFNPGGPGSVAAPSNYPESFSVGATDENDSVADFSLRGPSPYDEIKPDITAPGVNIRSTLPGGEYGLKNGTSMASPAVTAVVALLRQVDASLSVDDLEQILTNTAIPLTDQEYPESPNNGYGYGLVDAFSAVSSIRDGAGRVEGKVVSNMEDVEEPVIDHTSPMEVYSGVDLDLTAQASDNVSVTSVVLEYQLNDGPAEQIEAERIDGNYQDGVYLVTIAGSDLEAGELTYRWLINDHGNNLVQSEEYSILVQPRLTVGYLEDFETEPIGWTSYGANNSWEWGVPTSGPGSAVSGDKVYATNLAGPYDKEMDATLEMPPIDLPDGQTFLQFQSWHDFTVLYGTEWNYGQVMISTDQEEWTELMRFGSQSEGWNHVEIDLSAYSGERIHIGFRAYSDFRITKDGWYLDDVAISDTSIHVDDQVSPTFEHVVPKETYVGMDLDLSIEVQDETKIASVELHYLDATSNWHVVDAQLVTGDWQAGEFLATIPAEQITGEVVSYQWVIQDYGNNEVVSEEYVVNVVSAITIGYTEDLEQKPVGWVYEDTSDSWEWGEPTSGPRAAVSGENVFATNLAGNYDRQLDATLVMPPIELPEGEAYLQFSHWYDWVMTGGVSDYGRIVVSTDQEDWTELERYERSSGGWIETEIDLSEYSGQRIYVGFHGHSVNVLTRAGWYIDDIVLTDTSSIEETNEQQTLQDDLNPNLIPLAAQISVLESGRTVNTNPEDGTFSFLHAAGSYMIKAEAYGYHSVEQEVTIVEDGIVTTNFILEEADLATISGRVLDNLTGEPIENATILLMEDANIAPVQSDENGHYSLTAYEGDYTLKIIAKGYHTEDIFLTLDGNVSLDISLEAFYTDSDEVIYYDDGTAENARVYYNAGNAWAVKMSLPEDKQMALVTEGIYKFWDTDFPSPGGTNFAVEIWDSSGVHGLPGERIAGPFSADAIRDRQEWTVVDLRDFNILVDDDFYMVYVQTESSDDSPALATDENGLNANRSYQYINGSWSQVAADEGNYMIRAKVEYLVDRPVISVPNDPWMTNESEVTITGTAIPDTETRLFKEDEEVGSFVSSNAGDFEFTVDLAEGENVFTVKSYLSDDEVLSSKPVSIILDTIAPELTITNPQDGAYVEGRSIVIEGTAEDLHLDRVTVNGTEAPVEHDNFSILVELEQGENEIEVMATDLAGNESMEVITVISEEDGVEIKTPVISQPENDTITNTKTIDIEGIATPNTIFDVRNNGEVIRSGIVNKEGIFYESVTLEEGSNTLSVVTVIDEEIVAESDSITVTVDTVAPELEVNHPIDGLVTDESMVVVEGTVHDDHLANVKVNQQVVDVVDGIFSLEVDLQEGENVISIVASDVAGNTTAKTVTVTYEPKQIEISNLLPETNQYVFPGDQVDVSFASNIERGKAQFIVKVPGISDAKLSSTTNFDMKEIEPGVYHGIWTVPQNVMMDGAVIQVEITDESGQSMSQDANGKLFISPESIQRISGDTRYHTAIEISKEGWEHADTVVLARGDHFADALAGVPLAHQLDAPILLTRKDELHADTLREIKRLRAKEVVILGETGAVSETIAYQLKREGLDVSRIGGETRYDTAAMVADVIAPEGMDTVVVTSGKNFPDAFSVAAYAAQAGMPILLTDVDVIPEATNTALAELGVEETIVVGGTVAISEDVVRELPGAERLRGKDRYETNVVLAEHFNVLSNHMYVTTGQLFADALTGAVLAAKQGTGILLVGNDVPDAITGYLTDSEVNRLTIFGGEVAVNREIEDQLLELIH